MRKQTRTLAMTIAATLLASAAFAQDVTVRLSHWVPPTHPIAAQSLGPWSESITAASGGTINFQIFPSAQLGAPVDHYDMARDGIADVTFLNPGFSAGRFPVFGAISTPMLVSDAKGGITALNEWYRSYAQTEMADVKFCLGFMLSPLIFHTTKPVERPSDLAGMKIRPSSAMEAAFISAHGGATVPGSNPEAREMISRGVIDGTTGVIGSNYAFGVMDVTQFHTMVPFSAVSFAIVMNKAKYDGMSEDQKAVIDDHCGTEAAVKWFSAPQAFEDEGEVKLRASTDGRTIIEPSPEALVEWKTAADAARGVWAEEATAKGLDADAIMTDLKTRLSASGALVE